MIIELICTKYQFKKKLKWKTLPLLWYLVFQEHRGTFPNDRAKRLADENYETPG
jgi:hypothetical protein